MSHDRDVDDQEECPVHGLVKVVSVTEGAPSMMGYGFDPATLDLSCGHRLTHDPFTGKPSVTNIVHHAGAFSFRCAVCGRSHFMERDAKRCRHEVRS